MKRVAEYNVLPQLDLEVLFHVLSDHFDLAFRSLSKLVDDQVRILAREVVEKHWDLKADRALQVTLAVGDADKPACDVVVVSDFGALCLTFYKLVSVNVAPRGITILLVLAGTQAIHRSIRSKNCDDFRFLHDKRVKELGERVYADFHHGALVKVIKT